ncbi:hypothetical protein BWR18_10200 [Tateyamaria omphalii]|uniref:Uncharacterized protein n=1 Tax=Tateyamaria omphalii TaxID=299262 RepID=A0A1P8MVF2_9RHOB|nr:hypothetical protein BWR18_10200 [Tateyamaria omphalii]
MALSSFVDPCGVHVGQLFAVYLDVHAGQADHAVFRRCELGLPDTQLIDLADDNGFVVAHFFQGTDADGPVVHAAHYPLISAADGDRLISAHDLV